MEVVTVDFLIDSVAFGNTVLLDLMSKHLFMHQHFVSTCANWKCNKMHSSLDDRWKSFAGLCLACSVVPQ